MILSGCCIIRAITKNSFVILIRIYLHYSKKRILSQLIIFLLIKIGYFFEKISYWNMVSCFCNNSEYFVITL